MKKNISKIIICMGNILIKLFLITLIVINFFDFWLITSDIPICIDSMEFKRVLFLNFLQIVLGFVVIYANKKNIFVVFFEVIFLFCWIHLIIPHTSLYKTIANYQFIVCVNVLSLICCILFKLVQVLRRTV